MHAFSVLYIIFSYAKTAMSRVISCLKVKNVEDCIYLEVWNVIYPLFVHIPSSFYIVYNLVEIIGEKYRSAKRIIFEIVVFSIFLFLLAQDEFRIYTTFLTLLWIVGFLFYIVISINIAYCIYTKNVDIKDRKTQNVISSMKSLQIICFIIIMMSIYDIIIYSFNYYSCIQALQYSIPALYLLIDAFIFNQPTSKNIYDDPFFDKYYQI